MLDENALKFKLIGDIPIDQSVNSWFTLSPTGPLIAGSVQLNKKVFIQIWDYWTSETVGRIPFETNFFIDFVFPLSFSPDGKLLVVTAPGKEKKLTVYSGPWSSPKLIYDEERSSTHRLDHVISVAWLDESTLLVARLVVGFIFVSLLNPITKRSEMLFTAIGQNSLIPPAPKEKFYGRRNHYWAKAACASSGEIVFMFDLKEDERKIVWLSINPTDRWKLITDFDLYSVQEASYSSISDHHLALVNNGQKLLCCHTSSSRLNPKELGKLTAFNHAGQQIASYSLAHSANELYIHQGTIAVYGKSGKTYIYQLEDERLKEMGYVNGEAVAITGVNEKTIIALRNDQRIRLIMPTPFTQTQRQKKITDDPHKEYGAASLSHTTTMLSPSKVAPPIETASELYREMRQRGLHLRNGNGRDDALHTGLCNLVGCPSANLQKYLDTSSLSAEDFLLAFISIAEPFAVMFDEIWQYLAEAIAPETTESIALRFGFPEAGTQSEVALEAFRRYSNVWKKFLSGRMIWSKEAIFKLYGLYRILLKGSQKERQLPPYIEGQPYQLPEITRQNHPFDAIISDLRRLFQRNIDAFARQTKAKEKQEASNLDAEIQLDNQLGFPTSILTADLLPFWLKVFDNYEGVPKSVKAMAMSYYETEIRPLLKQQQRPVSVNVRMALNILDLPFWRKRWHTYEVWASVTTLKALHEFKPRLRVKNNHLPIDGYKPAIIADLECANHSRACVAIQVETPFRRNRRKAIKPDLRILFTDRFEANQTAAVVEFKQRADLSQTHITEMSISYSEGSPQAGGVLVLNYDLVGASFIMPPKCKMISNMHPCNPQSVTEFQAALRFILEKVNLRPQKQKRVVLLDVSTSMRTLYDKDSAHEGLQKLYQSKEIEIFAFSNGLISKYEVDSKLPVHIVNEGGTELGKTIEELNELKVLPSRLLIVTDGRFYCRNGQLESIPEVRLCLPYEIESYLDWITGDGRIPSIKKIPVEIDCMPHQIWQE